MSRSTLVLFLLALLPGTARGGFNSNTFGGLEARSIGPAVMSGRIAAIEGVPGDPLTVYVGAAGGGVWKSTDAGTTFKPVFDDYPQCIGAIQVDPSHPEIVWVGTGESWVRNSVGVGRGVYRSGDGGENWKLMGLTDTERIGAIRVSSKDGNVVFVAALGHLWNANQERGVFRTKDGGATWEKVLYVDENTGCADLDLDPQNPDVIYAAMWQFRRSPDFFESGGPGSGLYRSTDGGDTWTRLTEGLPAENLGRIAVAVAPSRPSTVYASVECKNTALYRSDDLGGTWKKLDASPNVAMRPFYFSEMEVDPTDYRRVYKCSYTLGVSTDGGVSFSSAFSGAIGGGVHPDHHALWINPQNPKEMFLGTDGGVYVSQDGGSRWRHVKKLPVSQFYHVAVDNEWPYHVYGGLQDNGAWMAPSRSAGGIQGRDWRNIGFGDGFWAFADPKDANTVYSEYQGGRVSRLDLELGEAQSIPPYAEGEQKKLRFNWNTPMILGPSGALFLGSQYLHRSRDRGVSWEVISPDLTTDDPKRQRQEQSGGLTIDNTTAENNATIFTVSESPLDPKVIWVGTDDGNLQVTRDDGATWTNVAGKLPGVPAGTWVSNVHTGPYAAGTAFVTCDGHRTGDMTTYVFRTDDFGASWISLADSTVEGFAHVIVQDVVNPGLLFLGTEFGLYVSLDGGSEWAQFKQNLPPVSVQDIAIQTRDQDVVLATHGRGVYIIDDISPLRALTPAIMESDVALLPARPAPMAIERELQEFEADDQFVGANPPAAAWISYYMKKRHMMGDLKVEVLDADGKVLKTIPGKKNPGINRVAWPMRLKAPKVPPANTLVPAFQGPRVPEGEYHIRLVKGDTVLDGAVALVPDPRTPHSADDRSLQQKTALHLYDMLTDLTFVVESIVDLRDQARTKAKDVGESTGLGKSLTAFADEMDAVRGTMVVADEGGLFAGKEELRERLGDLYGAVVGYDGRPTDSQLSRMETLDRQLADAGTRFQKVLDKDVAAINGKLSGKGEITPLDRAAWDEKAEGSSTAGMESEEGFMPWADLVFAGLGYR